MRIRRVFLECAEGECGGYNVEEREFFWDEYWVFWGDLLGLELKYFTVIFKSVSKKTS